MANLFYLDINVCEHCKRAQKTLFIGRSSPKTAFVLSVDPDSDYKIRELPDWIELWNQPGNRIRNDLGETVPSGLMTQIVANRVGRLHSLDEDQKRFLETQGNMYFDPNILMFARKKLPFGEFGKGTYQLLERELEVK